MAFSWSKIEKVLVGLPPASLVLFGFLVLIVCGSILLLLPFMVAPGSHLHFLDALFTATSAVCVTGLIVVDTATFFSFWGQLTILLLLQIGGLGYMTVTTLLAMAVRRRIEYRGRLALRDSFSLDVPGGVVRFVIAVLKYTFFVESVGALILLVRFWHDFSPSQALFLAIFHAISAFCNAGFSLFSNSLENFVLDPVVSLTVMGLIILGGIGFVVMKEVMDRGGFYSLHSRMVMVATIVLIVVGGLLVLTLEWDNPRTLGELPLGGKVLTSFFQAVTPRTAGFNTVPIRFLRPETGIILMLLMFVGASPGGTGGGVKTTTFAVFWGMLWSFLHGRERVEFFHRRISPSAVYKAVALIGLAFTLIFVSGLILLIFQSSDLLDTFFEVFSAFGTVGLSRGLTPFLKDVGKVIIILNMYLGRVGIITVLLSFRLAQERKEILTYPEERILM
ncbi:MAG: TrkH family potassium uptake protein [Candidatus Caldatribacteriaceae bacterium]